MIGLHEPSLDNYLGSLFGAEMGLFWTPAGASGDFLGKPFGVIWDALEFTSGRLCGLQRCPGLHAQGQNGAQSSGPEWHYKFQSDPPGRGAKLGKDVSGRHSFLSA